MCIEKIVTEVANFRAAMVKCYLELDDIFQYFPRGCCGDVSMLLAAYLKDQGLGSFALVSGIRQDHQSHAWLERGDIIIDATVDQFSDGTDRSMVTTEGRWYIQFAENRQRFEDGDFRLDEGINKVRLTVAYSHLIKHIPSG